MKKYLLLLFVIIFLLNVSERANAGIYILGTFGSGGEIDASSFGGEIGAIWPSDEPKYLLGIGGAWANTSYKKPYTLLLDKVRENDYELYGAMGISLIRNLFIVGTGGVARGCEGTVLKGDSASECEAYEGNDVKTKFAGSGQLRYLYKYLIIGVGYDNIRGIIGGVGFRFPM
jgi:hypothetical protein